MLKQTIILAAIVGLVLALAPAAQAELVPVDIDIKNSYVPSGLVEGNQFRLVFVTTGTVDASQTSLDDYYNPHVTTVADSVESLKALGTTWMAIGSTADVDARDNTYTNSDTADDASVPIYRLDGAQVATGNLDLWDGSIMAPISLTETLGAPNINAPYTGTNTTGVAWYPLGGNPLACGQTGNTDSTWIAFTQWGRPRSGYPIYAMSGIFIVEPGPAVDAADYIALKTHIGQGTSAGETEGDFNDDGDVNWDDLQILQGRFSELNAANANAIPEPASLLIMMAAGLPALLKRRRSQS